MEQLLNTLFVMTENAYVHVDHETVKVEVEKEIKLEVPMHHLSGLTVFGSVLVSPGLIGRFGEDGRSITWLSRSGHFVGRLEGPVSGNVLLRKAQWEAVLDGRRAVPIARNLIAGKIQNARTSVLRSAREADLPEDKETLQSTASSLGRAIEELPACDELETLRGKEGEAARTYFSTLTRMVRTDRETFKFEERSKRPPKDPINALLSFLYALLLSDCVGAAQGVGLDPQAGFLHALRSGRPALGLDMMEELRPVFADRLALTLVNRKQITRDDFDFREGGAVLLNEKGRKKVVVAYQERKKETITHPILDQEASLGLVPHLQARLMARTLRGDLEAYPPFLCK